MRHATLLSVLALGLAAASPARADDNAVSVSVAMADLDLSKPADAARLRTRLGRAATAACASPGTHGVVARQAFGACKTAAFAAADRRAARAIAAARIGGSGEIKTARR